MADLKNIRRIADDTVAVLTATLGNGKTAIVKNSDKANIKDAHGNVLNYSVHAYTNDNGDFFMPPAIDQITSHSLVYAIQDIGSSVSTLIVENKDIGVASAVVAEWKSGAATAQIKLFGGVHSTNADEFRIGGTSTGSSVVLTVDTETVLLTLNSNLSVELDGSMVIDLDTTTGITPLKIDSESTDSPALIIDSVGGANNNPHINLTGSSTNGSPSTGDFWRDGDNLFFRNSTTTINLSNGSSLISDVGVNNIFVGNVTNKVGTDNTIVGEITAGALLAGSFKNTVLGSSVANVMTLGNKNVVIGFLVARDLTIGFQNTIVGTEGGDGIVDGSDNVWIGFDTETSDGALQGSIAIGNGITENASNTCIIGGFSAVGGGITRVFFGRNITSGAPDAITLALTGGGGTDISGANFTIQSSNGTGDQGSGSLIFQTAPAAGTSSTPNTMETRISILKDGGLTIFDLGADPANPANGSFVMWQSDGGGTGADGDILFKAADSVGGLNTINLTTLAASGLTAIVEDTTPQLGGQLDVNGFAIGDGTRELITFVEDGSAVNHIEIENNSSAFAPIIRSAGDDTNIDLNLESKGTGAVTIPTNFDISGRSRFVRSVADAIRTVVIDNASGGSTASALKVTASGLAPTLEIESSLSNPHIRFILSGSNASPTQGDLWMDGDALNFRDSSTTIDLTAGGGGGLSNIVEDTTPQLGGQLDVNTFAIGDGTRELITFVEDASAVNNIEIENQATGSGAIIRSTGDDTNVDLVLETKGTGAILVDQNANGIGINIDSEATTSPAIVIDIVAGDAHIRFVGDSGNATPTEGDLWRESDGFKYFNGTDEFNLINPNREIFFDVRNLNDKERYRGVLLGASSDANFTFAIPANFGTLTSIEIVGIPNANLSSANIDIFSHYAADGEDADINAESNTTLTVSMTNGNINTFSISSIFSSIAAGDFCGLNVQHNSIGTSVTYIGIVLKYTTT